MNLKSAARSAIYGLGLAGLYYRLFEWRYSRGGEPPPATDEHGTPIPSPYLIMLVSGHGDWRKFLSTGESSAKIFAACAAEAGAPFSGAGRILDLGCGSGRIIRHLPRMTDAALFGCDYNPVLVRWCAKNLKGDFRRNRLRPPLDYPDGHFDIVYLLSVFTHLRFETQREWLAELSRVIRPGGLALITFHDEEQPGFPESEAARKSLAETGSHIHNDRAEGSNLIATFQTREFTRKLFGERFEVAKIIPSRESGLYQAIAVLRKRALN